MGIKRRAEEVTVNGGLCELIAGGCQNHGVMQFAAGGGVGRDSTKSYECRVIRMKPYG